MAIISTAKLETISGSVKRNKLKNSGGQGGNTYLMYPNNMKDGDLDGQDRIEFTLKEYNKDYKKETLPTVTGPKNPNSTTPFEKTSVFKEDLNFYDTSAILINGNKVERVFLPIQDKIQDTNAVSWGDGQLNDLQRRIANLSYNAMRGDDINVDKSIDAMKELLDDSALGTLGRLSLVEQIIGVQGLLTRATGKILNPNLELLFNTPSLRPFTFNFKLSPRDEAEAANVKSILRFFKQGMAPRIQQNNLFIKSPFLFSIRYLIGSNTKNHHTGIGKIKTCALQTCTVDYTPNNSYMTYRDGTMVSYNINMTFQELLPVYDKDYSDNHPIGY